MMPSYCVFDAVLDAKVAQLIAESWQYALSGEASPFLEAKSKNSHLTPLVFFFDIFYEMFFKLCPEAKAKFTMKISSQGRMFASLFKYLVSVLSENNIAKLTVTMEQLAVVHNQRKIAGPYYSTLGSVLLYALRESTGSEYFTDEKKDAWVRVYSRMMQVIIPIVVAGTKPSDAVWLKKKAQYERQGLINESWHAQAAAANDESKINAEKNSPSQKGATIQKTPSQMTKGVAKPSAMAASRKPPEVTNSRKVVPFTDSNKVVPTTTTTTTTTKVDEGPSVHKITVAQRGESTTSSDHLIDTPLEKSRVSEQHMQEISVSDQQEMPKQSLKYLM